MTPAELREAGQALYGERWQSSLARVLGVTVRTVQRWSTGEWPIPPGRANEIGILLRSRGMEALKLADRIT